MKAIGLTNDKATTPITNAGSPCLDAKGTSSQLRQTLPTQPLEFSPSAGPADQP